MPFLKEVFLLILVMDPIGNAVDCAALLKDIDPKRAVRIAVRESIAAILILYVFLFGGKYLLQVFQIRESVLSIAGGAVLFLIAIRMIFTPSDGVFGKTVEGEPFIVPIATPMLAGPSAIAVLLLFGPSNQMQWALALAFVWVVMAIALIAGTVLRRFLGERGTAAISKLMGMILTALSIQMIINGIEAYLKVRAG